MGQLLDDLPGLGGRVQQRRMVLGLSQRELAGEEMSASYISRIESGERLPTLDLLATIAFRLETTPSALIAEGEGHEQSRSSDRRALDLRWAQIAMRAGEPDSAASYAQVVADDPEASDTQRRDARIVLAGSAEASGRLDEAIEILEPLVQQLDAGADRELWRSCQVMLCRCYKDVGDLEHAVELGERALVSETEVMSDEQIMLAVSLGGAYIRRGDLKRADRLLSMILQRAEVAGSHRNQGAALWNASLVAQGEGRLEDAVALSERALALFGESDAVRNLGRLRVTYASLLRQESAGASAAAREQLMLAQGEFDLEGTVIEKARCLTELARCALDEDDLDEAQGLILRATDVIEGGPTLENAKVALVRGDVLVRRGDTREGLRTAQDAVAALDVHAESPREVAQAWRDLAALAQFAGWGELVVEAFDRAVSVLGIQPNRIGTADPQHTHEPLLSSSPAHPSQP